MEDIRKPMTRKKAILELKKLQDPRGDVEMQHNQADYILCALLESLGYENVVDEWVKVPKWYA